MKKNVLGVLWMILLAGCASTNTVKLSNKSYLAKSKNCAIKVYSQVPQNLKYEEIALLSARSGGDIFGE